MYGRLLIWTVAGMEFSWLYGLLLLWSQRSGSPQPPVFGLLGFYALGFGLLRGFTGRARWRGARLQVLIWFAWFVLLLLLAKFHLFPAWGFTNARWISSFFQGMVLWESFPGLELLMALSSALLWWCGGRLARLEPLHSLLLSEFQFGAAILLIVFLLESQWNMGLPGLFPLTMAFFLFALLGLAVAHAQGGSGWLSGEHRGRWLGLMVIVVCLVFAAGLLLGSLVRPDLLDRILDLIRAIGIFLLEMILKVIAFLASLFPEPEPYRVEMPVAPTGTMERDPSLMVKLLRIPESVRRVAGMIVATMWILLFLAALWSVSATILAWLRRKVDQKQGVEVEALSGAFLEDVLALVRFLLGMAAGFKRRLLRLWRRPESAVSAPREIATLRGIYRQFLRWAAKRGCPRHATETPREYLCALVESFPDVHWEMAFITHQYVRVRYGPSRPTEETLEKVNAVWERVRQATGKEVNGKRIRDKAQETIDE